MTSSRNPMKDKVAIAGAATTGFVARNSGRSQASLTAEACIKVIRQCGLKASDINVNDTTPRQLLLVTRQLHPNGLTGTQVGFAGRPKSSAYAARRTLAAALRPQRNYQKSLVTITGTYYDNLTIAASGTSGYSLSSLAPGDTLVRAKLRINYITGTSPSVGVAIVDATNTVQDVTTLLKGPWTVAPVNLDITGFAGPDIFSRLAVALINKNGSNSVVVSFQILVDVLR